MLTICRIPPYADMAHMVYVSYPLSWLVTLIFQSSMFMFAMRRLRKTETGGIINET